MTGSHERADGTREAEREAMFSLVCLPEMGPRRLRELVEHTEPSTALRWLKQERWSELPLGFRECAGVGTELLSRWSAHLRADDPARRLEEHIVAGVEVAVGSEIALLEPWCSDPEPPAALFTMGKPIELARPRVAIVGTRRCTAYGRAVATAFGRDLALAGATVVSGVASGIDGAAQAAALDAGGAVVGVVGSGLDRIYPRSNASLWHRLATVGTLLSEYPLGTPPARWRFPARNRLIAALSDAVVVVESPESGGSLYTVDAALERDREVLAVPGPVTARTSAGPNRLLVEGAIPVRGASDVMAVLGVGTGKGADPDTTAVAPPGPGWLFDALGWEAASLDELVLRTGRPMIEVTAALGHARAMGTLEEHGGWWERAR